MIRDQLKKEIKFNIDELKEYEDICKLYNNKEIIKNKYIKFISNVLSTNLESDINITTNLFNIYDENLLPLQEKEINSFLVNKRLIYPNIKTAFHFGFGDMNINVDDSFNIRELVAYNQVQDQIEVPVWVGQIVQSPLKNKLFIDKPIQIVSTYLSKGYLGVNQEIELSHYKKIINTLNTGYEEFDKNFDVIYEGNYINNILTKELMDSLLKIKNIYPNFTCYIHKNMITCSFKTDKLLINFVNDKEKQQELLQDVRKEIGIVFTLEQFLR